jgi:predicted metalloprotease with PDZ domain
MNRLHQKLPRIWKSTHLRIARVALAIAVLCATAQARVPQDQPATPLDLQYSLRLDRPSTHLLDVEIAVRQVIAPNLDFVMPAWAPGRYAIYDFAKNVQEFSAVDAQDRPLAWKKIDKQTWRVATGVAEGTIRAHYRVFANDLTGSFSQFDTSHAAVNGASVFMYIRGHKPDPLTLNVDAPPKWRVISGFSASTAERSFRVPNYDRLVDTPLEISPACTLDEFQEQGKTFRVAIHSYDDDEAARAALVAGVRKIVQVEMAGMPPPDFREYTFLFHFSPDIAMGDGMEHLNSTSIIVRATLQTGVQEALETAAHEFFHLWNIKRLRPEALGPFDYTRENYTRSLWFGEGVTSYFAYCALLRSGLWTRDQFLDRLGEEIRTLEQEPGRALMSAESSSFNAWFYDRSPQMQETNFANATISYYNKGALLGLLLDLQIRAKTHGQKSLRDVLVDMYRKFYESPAATYYGPGHGYEEADILAAVDAVAGSDFTSFFDRYVRGTAPLPYAETLKLAGLELRTSVAPGTPPDLGVLVQPDNLGVRIFAVRPGGAADRAGLSRDDLLVAVDDQSLATEELGDRLNIYPPGAKVLLTVQRHGQREIVTVTLDPPAPNEYAILELAGASQEQIAVRNAWLGEK